MERLKSVFFLSMIVVAVPVFAQQEAAGDSRPAAVAVIGDVELCQTLPVPQGALLTVREATMKARPLSESVHVTVIRSTRDHAQWTQIVSATSPDNGEPVQAGDVLVVQSLSPLQVAVKRNAALRTDSGLNVVSLEDAGICIGDVLQQTGNLPMAENTLKVICRFHGQKPLANPELHDPISHGDVISISRARGELNRGFGDMVPTVSEWNQHEPEGVRNASIPNALPSLEHRDFQDGSGSPPLQFPEAVPTVDSQTMNDASAVSDVLSVNSTTSDIEDSPFRAMESSTLMISQSEEVQDAATPETTTHFASAASTVAPVAPPQIQMGAVAKSRANAFNPWNFVFIGGLLLAGTLILAGTLKSDPDDNTEFSHAAARATDLIANTARQQKTTTSAAPSAASISRSVTPASVVEPVKNSRPAAAPSATLVSDDEWFGRDWQGRTAETSIGADEVDHTISTPKNQSTPMDDAPTDARPMPRTSEDEATRRPAFQVPGYDSTTSAEKARFEDLEDLLQNRLPIDLCTTQLPLRIALFGKPAGPQRLRIDAAHAAIPAPHMATTADKRREQPVAVSTAAASQMRNSSASTSQKPSEVVAPGSLDRALHFLQERTES
ncbi:MAG: hypothetical protein KDB01_08665 [Planctomycetaceae bacterium]|nr:hypothetical protein [Planctomycetaceae bacterium]